MMCSGCYDIDPLVEAFVCCDGELIPDAWYPECVH
jgi:hypothetical protein